MTFLFKAVSCHVILMGSGGLPAVTNDFRQYMAAWPGETVEVSLTSNAAVGQGQGSRGLSGGSVKP